MGYVHLMMYTPRCAVYPNTGWKSYKNEKEKKGDREKIKDEEKRYKCELRHRIFRAEQRSMGLVLSDYPKRCEGDRLLQ